MSALLRVNDKMITLDKVYNVKFNFGENFIYGLGIVYSDSDYETVDILIHNGGVTTQNIENVIFLNQIHQ